jgi:hypothetical protein
MRPESTPSIVYLGQSPASNAGTILPCHWSQMLPLNTSNMDAGIPHNVVYYENAVAKEIIFVGEDW